MSPRHRLQRLCLIVLMWTMSAPLIFVLLHTFYAVVDTHQRNAPPPHGRTLGKTRLVDRLVPFQFFPD